MQPTKDHAVYIKKMTCYEEGSCNNCDGHINASGIFAPDDWVWVVYLKGNSFRLCADCMKNLKKEIKENVNEYKKL